ncbi:MAG TPA: hypothetical protein VNN74_09840 [Candidatus Micrarchaeia archaeon]|nr:hypothetical protein [Candidatus Micrarchaeia archaeon]
MADQPSFEREIKVLFRESDRDAMESTFDLWDAADVRENAAAILEAVEQGSMPCDGAWPEERVGLLRRWVDSGMAD